MAELRARGPGDTLTRMTRSVQDLPKAHLHLHFTGSMRIDTVRDLAREHGIRLPDALVTGWPPRAATATDERGWFRFQRLYDAARACVRGEADMRRIVREAAADDAAEGSRWLELQVDPTSYAPFVGGITPALEIVLDEARQVSARGRHRGRRSSSRPAGCATPSRPGRSPGSPPTTPVTRPGDVVGFGLSNDERRGLVADFAPAFAIARRGRPRARAPRRRAARRPVGHGDARAPRPRPHRPRRAQRRGPAGARRRSPRPGVTLEVCPGSNVALGVYADAGEVPLRRIVDAGIPVALGADDPLLFGTRLAAQYAAARDLGFDDAELAAPRPRLPRGQPDAARPAQGCARRRGRVARRSGVTSTAPDDRVVRRTERAAATGSGRSPRAHRVCSGSVRPVMLEGR